MKTFAWAGLALSAFLATCSAEPAATLAAGAGSHFERNR